MNHFIKLSGRLINKLHIAEILHSQNKFYIYMSIKQISGFWTCVFGNISSHFYTIEICEKKNKEDYNEICKFFNETK